MGGRGDRGGRRHQPRVAGERNHKQICAASDPTNCGEGERRSSGEVGGTGDSTGQFGDWRGVELLVRARVGATGEATFSTTPSVAAAAGAAGGARRDESGKSSE